MAESFRAGPQFPLGGSTCSTTSTGKGIFLFSSCSPKDRARQRCWGPHLDRRCRPARHSAPNRRFSLRLQLFAARRLQSGNPRPHRDSFHQRQAGRFLQMPSRASDVRIRPLSCCGSRAVAVHRLWNSNYTAAVHRCPFASAKGPCRARGRKPVRPWSPGGSPT